MSSSRRGSLTSMSSRSRSGAVASATAKQKRQQGDEDDNPKKLSSDSAGAEPADRGMKGNKTSKLLPKKDSKSLKAATTSKSSVAAIVPAVSTKRTRSSATMETMKESAAALNAEERSEKNTTNKEVSNKKQKRDDTVTVSPFKEEDDDETEVVENPSIVKKKKNQTVKKTKGASDAVTKTSNKKKPSATKSEEMEKKTAITKKENVSEDDDEPAASNSKSSNKSKKDPVVIKKEENTAQVSLKSKGKNKKGVIAGKDRVDAIDSTDKTEKKKTIKKIKSEEDNDKAEKLSANEEKNLDDSNTFSSVPSPARKGLPSLNKDESKKKSKTTKEKSIKVENMNIEGAYALAHKQEIKEDKESPLKIGKTASMPAKAGVNLAGVSSLPTSKAVKKKSKKQQEVGKPSRPLSAYNLFFKDTRLILLEEQKNKAAEPPQELPKDTTTNEGGEPPVRRFRALEEMVKEIGKRWKEFDPEKKSKYHAIAEAETKRYKEQMLQYRKEQKAAIAIAKAELKKEKALASKQMKKGSKKAGESHLDDTMLTQNNDGVGTLDSDATKKRKTTKSKAVSKENTAVASLPSIIPQGQGGVTGQPSNLRGSLGQGGMFNQINEQQLLQLQLQQQQRMMLEQRELQELMMKHRIQEQLVLLQRQQLLSGRGMNDASSMLDGSVAFNHQMASQGIVSGDIDVSTLSDAELHLLVERRRLQQSMAYEQSLLADNFGTGLLMSNNSQQGTMNTNGTNSNGRQSLDGMSATENNASDMQRLLMNQKIQQLQAGSAQNSNQQEQSNDALGNNYNRLSLSSESDLAQQRELQLRRRLMMANMASQGMYAGTAAGVSSGAIVSGTTATTPAGENRTGANNAMNPPASAGATGGTSVGNTELSPFMSSGVAGARGSDDQEFRRPSIVSLSTDEGAAGNMMNMYNNANQNDAIRRLILAQQQQQLQQQQHELIRKQQLMELYSPNPVNYPGGTNF
jgi:HMG-box domain